jgi:hypothetical protein
LARPIYVWPRPAPLPSEESNDEDDDDISGGETYAFRKAFKRSTICRSSLTTRAFLNPPCFVWRARRARHSMPRNAIASGGSAGLSANGSAKAPVTS